MVNQVQVVAILMIVNGALVSLMGLIYAAMGPFMYTMNRTTAPPSSQADQTILTVMSSIYLALGLLVLLCGILNIVAGIRSLNFRGRTLALVALFGNLTPMFTCYCLPTSLGLMIYGLIVFFQADVARAFQLVAEGVPAERLKRGWRPDEDEEMDEEEMAEDLPPERPREDHIQRDPGDRQRRPWPEEE